MRSQRDYSICIFIYRDSLILFEPFGSSGFRLASITASYPAAELSDKLIDSTTSFACQSKTQAAFLLASMSSMHVILSSNAYLSNLSSKLSGDIVLPTTHLQILQAEILQDTAFLRKASQEQSADECDRFLHIPWLLVNLPSIWNFSAVV